MKIKIVFLILIIYCVNISKCIVYANETPLPKLDILTEEYKAINSSSLKYNIKRMVITNHDSIVYMFSVSDIYKIAYNDIKNIPDYIKDNRKEYRFPYAFTPYLTGTMSLLVPIAFIMWAAAIPEGEGFNIFVKNPVKSVVLFPVYIYQDLKEDYMIKNEVISVLNSQENIITCNDTFALHPNERLEFMYVFTFALRFKDAVQNKEYIFDSVSKNIREIH